MTMSSAVPSYISSSQHSDPRHLSRTSESRHVGDARHGDPALMRHSYGRRSPAHFPGVPFQSVGHSAPGSLYSQTNKGPSSSKTSKSSPGTANGDPIPWLPADQFEVLDDKSTSGSEGATL